MGRITIKDIAKIANVSYSTVSRALADHPDISVTTKSKIRRIALELGYRPNVMAANFRKQNSGVVALIIPDFHMFFSPTLIKSISRTLRTSNMTLTILDTENSLEKEKERLDLCEQLAVEGVIISLSRETTSLTHLEELVMRGTPVVQIDRTIHSTVVSAVGIDNERAAFQAVKHLIEQGHKRIAGIFGDPQLRISTSRYRGYEKALSAFNIPVDRTLVQFCPNLEAVEQGMQDLLNQSIGFTALFCMTDEVLLGAQHIWSQNDLTIPEDLSVVSISDGSFPNYLSPKITYVHHSAEMEGNEGVSLLLDIMKKRINYSVNRLIETKLIKKYSVASPSN